MASKMVKFFWEHPVRFILRLFLIVTTLCLLWTLMPKWFNIISGVLLLGALIMLINKYEIKEEKSQQEEENAIVKDYEKIYTEYGDLVSRKINELEVDKSHIYPDWLQTFYAYFQKAAKLCNKGKFTDFHIAACIIFALVFYTDDIEHIDIIYKCVRELIAKPRVYIRHIEINDEITVEVEKTLPEVDLRLIEDVITPVELAKIIKEMYIKNKTEKALIELADFLNRVYLSCI